MQAYCVKCRAKREMKDARPITMKNGKPATQGHAPFVAPRFSELGRAEVWTYAGYLRRVIQLVYVRNHTLHR